MFFKKYNTWPYTSSVNLACRWISNREVSSKTSLNSFSSRRPDSNHEGQVCFWYKTNESDHQKWKLNYDEESGAYRI